MTKFDRFFHSPWKYSTSNTVLLRQFLRDIYCNRINHKTITYRKTEMNLNTVPALNDKQINAGQKFILKDSLAGEAMVNLSGGAFITAMAGFLSLAETVHMRRCL